MSNEEIQQRIAYLVEHGGLYDDPIEDIRKTARIAVLLSLATLIVLGLVLIFHP
jgi:hypothetical protein